MLLLPLVLVMKMTPSDRDRGTFLGGAIGLAELLVFTILFLDIIFNLGDARMMGFGHGGIAGNGGMDGQTGVGHTGQGGMEGHSGITGINGH
jgi:hypothetical protein